MDILFWIFFLFKVLLGVLLAGLVGFVALPLILAEITRWRNSKSSDTILSSLYVGRVWHARLLPKHHGFNYPLFVFALDLEEVEDLFADKLWPLSLVVSFRNRDHLKNGEGSPKETVEKSEIANRVLRMVSEKTKNEFQPTLETHRVLIVTHLCYYGYCFNPVSFYYLQDKATDELVTVVAEVSNTPWNEMHCYVLHPSSIDQAEVLPDVDSDNQQKTQRIRYKWPKRFHVSPFMEMKYMYDWTFTNFKLQTGDPLLVRAAMKRGDQIHFTAKVDCSQKGLHPYTIAWQLIYYPTYCFIIQLWIHYEAIWLFVKGIAFVPHPNDTETALSSAIGAVMTPLFALKDWLDQIQSKSASTAQKDELAMSDGKEKIN